MIFSIHRLRRYFIHVLWLSAVILFCSSCSAPYVCDVPQVPRDWQTGDVQANGIRLHYYRTGAPDMPAMLLLHGFTDNGLCWMDFAREFEGDYNVIMYDYRGHGFSEAPETGYTIDDYTADAVGFIGAMRLDKPIIVGHSLGGSIAATLALRRPDIPAGIVLIDPPGVTGPLLDTKAKEKDAMRWFKKDIPYLKRASLETLLKEAGKRHPQISEACRRRWADAKVQMSPQIAVTILNLPDLKDQWAQIQVPTLILKADTDAPTRQRELDAVKNAPQVRLVHIDGAGHLVHMERPEAAIAEVRRFLD